MNVDFALVGYVYLLLGFLLGGLIFTINWIRVHIYTNNEVSKVYKYMTFFLWAESYNVLLATIARWYTLEGGSQVFRSSLAWHTRSIPVSIILTIFVFDMYHRFFIGRKHHD